MAIFLNQQVHTNSGIYEENTISKSYGCEYIFCEEKQNLGLSTYHLKGLRVPLVVRVPQFGNHCLKWTSYICFCTVNSGNVRFICLAAQTLAEKQSSVKVFFITQIGHRSRGSNSNRGPNEVLKKKHGRVMTILELHNDADAKKAVPLPETY